MTCFSPFTTLRYSVLYPRLEYCSCTSVSRLIRTYCPSKSVVTPVVLPGTEMLTKGTGSPVFASLTMPRTDVCPCAARQARNSAAVRNRTALVLFIGKHEELQDEVRIGEADKNSDAGFGQEV